MSENKLYIKDGKQISSHLSTLNFLLYLPRGTVVRSKRQNRLQSMGSLSQTRLSDFTFTFYFHALEKEMATHSSVLAWRIPGTGIVVGCHLWGCTESDTTEVTQQQQQQQERFMVISIPALNTVGGRILPAICHSYLAITSFPLSTFFSILQTHQI